MTWKNRKRLAMVRIQLRKTLKYLLHVGFTEKDQVNMTWSFSMKFVSYRTIECVIIFPETML